MSKRKLIPFLTLAVSPLTTASAANFNGGDAALADVAVPFVANVGQLPPSVAFYAPTFSGNTFVTRDGELVYALPEVAGKPPIALRERFVNAHPLAQGKEPSDSRIGYLQRQGEQVRPKQAESFKRLDMGEVFDGVSVELVAKGRKVEKFFRMAPGADPALIRMRLAGQQGLHVNQDGTLQVQTTNGAVRFSSPVAWQEDVPGNKQPVTVSYVVNGDSYGFSLGEYDRQRPVIIDPLLQATYLGGSGTETAVNVKIHPLSGDVYLLGKTLSPGAGFPNTLPKTANGWNTQQAFTTTPYISRFSSDLRTLKQSTFLPNNAGNSGTFADGKMDNLLLHPVNGDAYLFVWGATTEAIAQYPFAGGTQAACNGYCNYIVRVSEDLTQAVQATFYDTPTQSGHRDDRHGVMISPVNGDIYVAGIDDRTNNDQASVKRIPANLRSAMTVKIFGASGGKNAAMDVAVHPGNGDVYVAGQTYYNDFPGTAGGYQPNNNSLPSIGMRSDGFIAQFPADLSTLKQATYLGGYYEEYIDQLAFDNSGSYLFIAGATRSSNFPGLAGGAYSNQPSTNSWYSSFIGKISTDLKTLAQTTISEYANQYYDGTHMDMLVNPLNNEVFAIGNGLYYNSDPAKTLGYPYVEHYAADLKSTLGGVALQTDNKHSGTAWTFSPADGDLYIAGQQSDTGTIFPKTAGGAQPEPATNSGGNYDAYIARYTSDDIEPNVPKADIQATLISNVDSVIVGNPVSCTLTIANNGPDAASSSKIVATLPAGVNFGSAAGCSLSSSTVTCNVGALANGATRDFTLAATPVQVGGATVTVNATANENDPVAANNSTSKTVAVTAAPPTGADLQVTQTSGAYNVEAGTVLSVQLDVVNNGPETASNVKLSNQLPLIGNVLSVPTGCSQGSGNLVNCSLGSMAQGETRNLNILVGAATLGNFTNNASASADQNDPTPGNNISSKPVIVSPSVNSGAPVDISLSLQASPKKIKLPKNVVRPKVITYTLLVKNKLKTPANNVVAALDLPADGGFISATAGCNLQENRQVVCSLATLKGKRSVKWKVKHNAPIVPATLQSSATSKADGSEQTPGNNVAGVAVVVVR